jgi:hypothetical protein
MEHGKLGIACKSHPLWWSNQLVPIMLQVIFWSLYSVAFFFTLLRVLARVRTHVSLKIDDYFAFLSFLILTVVTSLYSVMIPRYLEVHDILAANANVTKLMQDPELGGQVSMMLRFSFVRLCASRVVSRISFLIVSGHKYRRPSYCFGLWCGASSFQCYSSFGGSLARSHLIWTGTSPVGPAYTAVNSIGGISFSASLS